MSTKIKETWDEKLGLAQTTLYTEFGSFFGAAVCHPEDEDMKSEKVGLKISYHRATIKMLKHIKSQYLRPQIELLERMAKHFNHSSTFNPKCRENIILQRELSALKNDHSTISKLIVEEQKRLDEYIKGKDQFYEKIRSRRKVEKN